MTMEIEQKDRERIEAQYPFELPQQVKHSPPKWEWKAIQLARRGTAEAEHLYLQKKVIKPLREKLDYERICNEVWTNKHSKLEAENKALREALEYLVKATPNAANWDYQAAWDNARRLLTQNKDK